MNNIVLETHALSKHYRDVTTTLHVLTNVHLQVKSAERVAIIGHSGSGKSTLLHLLGGLDQPTSGYVTVAGQRLDHLSENEKCRFRNRTLGFVYQFHHLLPEFTALENVAMPLLIRSMASVDAETKAVDLLDAVGLKNRLHHKMSALSGGERQRVAIARALVTDPLCILADEPTGNLDPYHAEKVLTLFIELQERQKTSIVMVTHDRTIAEKADRILLLEKGELRVAD